MPEQIVVAGATLRRRQPWTPPILAGAGPLPWVGANIVVVALYFALGSVVNWFFASYGLFPAPIWLPASVAVVAAMVGDVRMLPGIFLGSFLANAILFAPPLYITTGLPQRPPRQRTSTVRLADLVLPAASVTVSV